MATSASSVANHAGQFGGVTSLLVEASQWLRAAARAMSSSSVVQAHNNNLNNSYNGGELERSQGGLGGGGGSSSSSAKRRASVRPDRTSGRAASALASASMSAPHTQHTNVNANVMRLQEDLREADRIRHCLRRVLKDKGLDDDAIDAACDARGGTPSAPSDGGQSREALLRELRRLRAARHEAIVTYRTKRNPAAAAAAASQTSARGGRADIPSPGALLQCATRIDNVLRRAAANAAFEPTTRHDVSASQESEVNGDVRSSIPPPPPSTPANAGRMTELEDSLEAQRRVAEAADRTAEEARTERDDAQRELASSQELNARLRHLLDAAQAEAQAMAQAAQAAAEASMASQSRNMSRAQLRQAVAVAGVRATARVEAAGRAADATAASATRLAQRAEAAIVEHSQAVETETTRHIGELTRVLDAERRMSAQLILIEQERQAAHREMARLRAHVANAEASKAELASALAAERSRAESAESERAGALVEADKAAEAAKKAEAQRKQAAALAYDERQQRKRGLSENTDLVRKIEGLVEKTDGAASAWRELAAVRGAFEEEASNLRARLEAAESARIEALERCALAEGVKERILCDMEILSKERRDEANAHRRRELAVLREALAAKENKSAKPRRAGGGLFGCGGAAVPSREDINSAQAEVLALQRQISELEREVAERDASIASLRAELGSTTATMIAHADADALAIVEQPQHEEQPPVTPPRLELAHLEEDHDDSVSEADTDTLLCDWEALRSELESLALASVENRSANMLPQALK
ncbi:hypothetical protein PPROV_000627300 [Pycnococcus provasolii]|uniref:Uncharacterized protein n=1 Tax=Pycnococcus provasolii TaxID=41880 RepID=A0A830HQ05_9CHLO|nr:hypothetical protein PPROV_000627300 [Pycnococcus provasolii]